MRRPTRKQLNGYSLSELKTMLKRAGHKVPRNLERDAYVTECDGRLFRWRWWADEFLVDRSEPIEVFDRWGNSTEESLPASYLIGEKL
jgi:hypothetical protein